MAHLLSLSALGQQTRSASTSQAPRAGRLGHAAPRMNIARRHAHARMQLIDCHETALHKVLSLVSENSALDLDGLVVYTASLCVLLSPSVGVDLALA